MLFLLFLDNLLILLIPSVIAQIFNPTADPFEMLTKEAKAEI